MDYPLDCFFADPDEPDTPNRSPSRLDFCVEDSGNSPTHKIDWAFRDDGSYTIIDEDAFSVDIAPLELPRLLMADPPQVVESHTHKNAETSLKSPVPPENPTRRTIIEPQAPRPLRPPSAQLQNDGQECTQLPRCTAQRLNYPHHGFSRSALLQQKMFWNSRHGEWVEWQSRVEQSDLQSKGGVAYTGIASVQPSPPPYTRTPPSGLERDFAEHPCRDHEQDIHSSIYPRVGDISALRDPYSMNIDRCFFRYPLWTLHKTLYVFYMNQRSTPPAPPPTSVYNTPQIQSSMSWSTLSSYTSSTTDDEESDSTLVADDSPVHNVQRRSEPVKHASLSRGTSSRCRLRVWELSWYARWELLIGLLKRDRCNSFDTSIILEPSPESKAASSSPPTRLFRFTLAGDDSDDDDDDDDEDEDYGTLLSHTRFSAEFDEECERALAFYCRESNCSETSL